MKVMRHTPLTEALVWFGLLAAPLAWAAQLVIGSEVEEASCKRAGRTWDLGTTDWQIALTAACGLVALAAIASAALVLRELERRRREGDPRGRVFFMAAGGLTFSPLFLFGILLSGIGASELGTCVQV